MSRGMVQGLLYLCGRKKAIKTKKLAKAQAKLMSKRYKTQFNHYRCRICEHYHVGRANKFGG